MSRNEYACAACVLQGVILGLMWLGIKTFDVSALGLTIIALIEGIGCVLVLGCAFAAGRDE